jgi:hypothetical protein
LHVEDVGPQRVASRLGVIGRTEAVVPEAVTINGVVVRGLEGTVAEALTLDVVVGLQPTSPGAVALGVVVRA